MVVAARQAGLDQEHTEFGAVEAKASGFLGDLRSSDVHRRGVVDQLFLNAVAVEAGDNHQLRRHGRGSEPAGFQVPGVQLDVWSTDLRERIEFVVPTPREPQAELVLYACRVPADE